MLTLYITYKMRKIEALEAIEDKIDVQEASKVLANIDEKGTIPFDQVKRELGLKRAWPEMSSHAIGD
jgi:hypothetical protein